MKEIWHKMFDMHCFQFDTNGDGEISTGELKEAMRKLLGQQVSAFGIERIVWMCLKWQINQMINFFFINYLCIYSIGYIYF